MNFINMDHVSANPLPPEVQEAMIQAIRANYGNPSSPHQLGEQASKALEGARESVAGLINAANPQEIVFTSCGTESINHALKGVAWAKSGNGKHIVTSNVEHNAVLKALRRLSQMNYRITSLPVDEYGLVSPKAVAEAITDETILVTIGQANSEIGSIQPIKEIAEITRDKKVVFHTDAVASTGVIPVDVQDLGVDLLSFSANQFYGPSGVGGLYIRRGTGLWALLDGGGQENNKRAGTENLIGIIGMGVAADLAVRDLDKRIEHNQNLKKKLSQGLIDKIEDIHLNGHPDRALPNLVSVSVKYLEGESIVLMLDEENIVVSTKSACASGSLRASHVLISIGMDFADAQGTLIFTFGQETTEADVDRTLEVLQHSVATLRDMSPLYHQAKKAGN